MEDQRALEDLKKRQSVMDNATNKGDLESYLKNLDDDKSQFIKSMNENSVNPDRNIYVSDSVSIAKMLPE